MKEGLSDDDKVVILTVFQEQIDKGQQLTLKEIRDRMRADLYLLARVVKALCEIQNKSCEADTAYRNVER